MRRRQHEIPTHLNVEDKLLLGLTMRQFLYVLLGASASYGVWNQVHAAPPAVRVALVAALLLLTATLVLVRPLGRPLEEWLLAGCAFAATPRRTTWRPAEPGPADWRPARGTWQALAPSPTWLEEDER